jgi:hypothetical protein
MTDHGTRAHPGPRAGAGAQTGNRGIAALPPGFFLLVNFVELVLLVLLFVGWQWEWRWLGHDRLPAVLWGVFPIVVPWAAAWGGWLISVKGVVGHWKQSSSPNLRTRQAQRLSWNAWYLVRVPMGIVLGTVGALLAVVFAGLVGTGADGRIDTSPLGTLTIALVAFVLGYRQQSFDALVQRVIDLITAKAEKAVQDEEADEGDDTDDGNAKTLRATVGEARTFTAVVTNPLDEEVDLADKIAISGPDKDLFQVSGPPATAAPNAEFAVPISFHPVAEGRFEAVLEVTMKDQTAKVKLVGWGNTS